MTRAYLQFIESTSSSVLVSSCCAVLLQHFVFELRRANGILVVELILLLVLLLLLLCAMRICMAMISTRQQSQRQSHTDTRICVMCLSHKYEWMKSDCFDGSSGSGCQMPFVSEWRASFYVLRTVPQTDDRETNQHENEKYCIQFNFYINNMVWAVLFFFFFLSSFPIFWVHCAAAFHCVYSIEWQCHVTHIFTWKSRNGSSACTRCIHHSQYWSLFGCRISTFFYNNNNNIRNRIASFVYVYVCVSIPTQQIQNIEKSGS